MKGKGAVVCEEIVDEPSGETRFKILVSVKMASSPTNENGQVFGQPLVN